jgi:hypothetical protein
MKKKIRDEYKGLVITFFAPGIGNVTFDPSKTQVKDYDNFARIGLDYIFDEEQEHICDENCEHNKEKTLEDFKKEVEDYSEKKPAKKGRKSMKSKLEEGEI